jgi:hypothetical protein
MVFCVAIEIMSLRGGIIKGLAALYGVALEIELMVAEI